MSSLLIPNPEVTFVPVSTTTGQVEIDDIIAALCPNTCLVSVMLANNETGVIMVSLSLVITYLVLVWIHVHVFLCSCSLCFFFFSIVK